MAFDAYLKLEGVEGEATRKGYEKQLFLDSFSWGATQPVQKGAGSGAGAGRVSISDFNVTKHTDKSSAKIFAACCKGQHFKTATVSILKAGGENPIDYIKYEFKELFVSSIQWSGASGGDDTPMESISFAFSAVTVTYTEQKADGTKGAAIVAGWDLKQAKAI